MGVIIFESASDYLESCKTQTERITALDAIIDKLLITASRAAESGELDEYWWDDGHIKIRSKYRNVKEVESAIASFQRLRDLYANRRAGRMTRLMDSSNFTGRGW
jgi:hypothetical protein